MNIGDKVDFVNDQEVVFNGKTIVGIEEIDGETRYHIEPTDCPWYPKRARNLRPTVFREQHEAAHGTDLIFTEGWEGPRYHYGYINRPFALAHQPKGFIIGSYDPDERVERDGKQSRHGVIQYPFALTDDELYSFELFLTP